MDIWVLDKTLEANDIVDTFNSLIWTDRYDEYGDFEIYTSVTDQALSLLQMDYYLQSRSSEHVMIIEEVLIDTDPENGNSVTITGRSLESLLSRRIVWTQTLLDTVRIFSSAILFKSLMSTEWRVGPEFRKL